MTSSFQVGIRQIDGRSWILETHRDALGRTHLREYLGDDSGDLQAQANRYGVQLEVSLKEAEVDRAETKLLTGAELLTGIREKFRAASGDEAARIATWIMDQFDAGRVTAAQLRTVFGMTSQQLTDLQARLTALRSAYRTIQNARGE